MTEQLRSKVALVTGGTDGVGKEIARGLAQLGAQVIIVGRDAGKGARAEREIRASSDNRDVEFIRADLSLMREARRLGDEVANRWPAMHYLVHSAGIVRGRRVVTAEGFEVELCNELSEPVRVDRPLAFSSPGRWAAG